MNRAIQIVSVAFIDHESLSNDSNFRFMFHETKTQRVEPSLMDIDTRLQTYQVGTNFEALDEGILVVPSDLRHLQVGFQLIFSQV